MSPEHTAAFLSSLGLSTLASVPKSLPWPSGGPWPPKALFTPSRTRMNDFKIKDPSLAPLGRKLIAMEEHEMPGLMACRAKYGPVKPLAGARVTGSLHMTVETAILIETLRELGADVRWASCNIFSTNDSAAAAIAAAGVPVFAWKGESIPEYWWCTKQAMTWPDGTGPDLIVDDGGDATLLLHLGTAAETDPSRLDHPASEEEAALFALVRETLASDPRWFSKTAARVRGVSEETTTGVHRLYQLEAENRSSSPPSTERLRDQVEVRQHLWMPGIPR
jgi:adenosylhomocysteinase